jgi:tetratricopeptide (TPR) repeat protein
VALDREDTLKKAEKLLRQGRLDNAIAEYLRVVEDQPRDWNTANTLGDLYARANQPARAVAQYARIADHFFQDGFYPKAAALYKKILKLVPDDESAQLQLADISAKLGLLKDAKTYYGAVAARRRTRGDVKGAAEIVVLLGGVDPSDYKARTAAAQALAESGDAVAAATKLRELHADLVEKGRDAEAADALREAVRLNPADVQGRALLASAALTAGDADAARGYLDRETAGDDPALLMALAAVELKGGDVAVGRQLLQRLLLLEPGRRDDVVALGWTVHQSSPEACFACVDAAVDASIAAGEFDRAASVLQAFIVRVPAHIPALLKLVEVSVDGGLETAMYEAQAQLADAYLATSQGAEARVIAEDLVAREPWEAAHLERFRRALVLLRIPEPDSVIANRLSGDTPFTATDHFSGLLAWDPTIPPADSEAPAHAVEAAAPVVEPPAEAPPETAAPAVAPPTATRKAEVASEAADIDLTSMLGDLDGEEESAPAVAAAHAGMDDVFTEFRKDATRQSAADQSAQHMKLARTYLEMGMTDEAVAALKNAARSPVQRFEAGSMLGRLYKAQGDLPRAVEWLQQAVEVPAPAVEEGRALLYDLAVTLEAAGDAARALALFLELEAEAGPYRDAAERAGRLARVQAGG